MNHKVSAALGLRFRDWWILGQAWFLLPAVDLALCLLPFRRVRDLMSRGFRQRGVREPGSPWPTIQRLKRLVDIAGRHHLYRLNCLPRSLVLQWLLSRRCIGTELRIGVSREGDGICAHAWLEHGGRPIDEAWPVEGRFAPLMTPKVGR